MAEAAQRARVERGGVAAIPVDDAHAALRPVLSRDEGEEEEEERELREAREADESDDARPEHCFKCRYGDFGGGMQTSPP